MRHAVGTVVAEIEGVEELAQHAVVRLVVPLVLGRHLALRRRQALSDSVANLRSPQQPSATCGALVQRQLVASVPASRCRGRTHQPHALEEEIVRPRVDRLHLAFIVRVMLHWGHPGCALHLRFEGIVHLPFLWDSLREAHNASGCERPRMFFQRQPQAVAAGGGGRTCSRNLSMSALGRHENPAGQCAGLHNATADGHGKRRGVCVTHRMPFAVINPVVGSPTCSEK